MMDLSRDPWLSGFRTRFGRPVLYSFLIHLLFFALFSVSRSERFEPTRPLLRFRWLRLEAHQSDRVLFSGLSDPPALPAGELSARSVESQLLAAAETEIRTISLSLPALRSTKPSLPEWREPVPLRPAPAAISTESSASGGDRSAPFSAYRPGRIRTPPLSAVAVVVPPPAAWQDRTPVWNEGIPAKDLGVAGSQALEDRIVLGCDVPSPRSGTVSPVTFRIFVSADGYVRSVVPETVSDAEYFRQCFTSLFSWRFAPVPSWMPQEDSCGTVSFGPSSH